MHPEHPFPVLVIGYGNPARGDDGLAPAFIERLVEKELSGITARVQYQLCVEDVLDFEAYSQVVFVDASMDVPPPFRYSALTRQAEMHLNTHSVSPGALIYLATTLFGSSPPAAILAIRGYSYQPFTEQLSRQAEDNLQSALAFFVNHFGH